jgi:hypothetical protein
LSQLKSGWDASKLCRYHWPSGRRVQAGPPNVERQLFGGWSSRPSAKMNRARRSGRRVPGLLEPGVLVGAVVGHQVHQQLQTPVVAGVAQPLERG